MPLCSVRLKCCFEIRGSQSGTAEGSSRPELIDFEDEALRSFEASVNCLPHVAPHTYVPLLAGRYQFCHTITAQLQGC